MSRWPGLGHVRSERRLVADTWTHEDLRAFADFASDRNEEWQGYPVPLGDDTPLVLHPRHPMRDLYPNVVKPSTDSGFDDGETCVNRWWCRKRQVEVFVIRDKHGRASVLTLPHAPDRSMERLTFWMTTIGGADAWDLDAEHKAREHLREMLTERQWRHYDLTGSFFETSDRSRVTYLFRRLRPTVALSPRGTSGTSTGEESMRCLAVLCLHPIGYYANSWAGCMVPTDDVIAHLSLCRGDEARYWGQAIQHAAHEPEAGL